MAKLQKKSRSKRINAHAKHGQANPGMLGQAKQNQLHKLRSKRSSLAFKILLVKQELLTERSKARKIILRRKLSNLRKQRARIARHIRAMKKSIGLQNSAGQIKQ